MNGMYRRKKKKKNDTFCMSPGRDDQITTSAKLLDTMHEYYGFSADLIEAMN